MDTTGYIYKEGTTPNTKAVISSKVKFWAPAAASSQMLQIGAATSFSISDSRSVDPIKGIGYGDQNAELIPGSSNPISLSVERTCLYLANIFQSFGYNSGIDGMVRALKHHRWPFDVKHEIVFSELANREFPNVNHVGPATLPLASSLSYQNSGIYALVTLYEGCWMSSYSVSYSNDGTAVSESTEIVVRDILDPNIDGDYNEFIDSGNSPYIPGQIASQIFTY